MEVKHINEFRPDDVLWEKISKGLLRNPDRPLKNTDKRIVLKCRANPNLLRRNFEPFDQMLYYRMVLELYTAYPIPAGTFTFRLQATSSYPTHVPAQTNKRPLEEQPGPSSKRNIVFITPIRPSVAPVLIAKPSTTLASPQPVIIPEPPVQIPPEQIQPVQIPDPPLQIPATPELTTPPVQIPLFQSPVQIPDPPVQIQVTPESTTPQPPVQLFLPDPPQPPVQILLPDPLVVQTLDRPLRTTLQ
ncbi:hypothetical protein TNCV_4185931 [Trichonephila clavipes]|nr:hypothetical protein TNCV_4185931 [Trichonephila clavipes]